MNSKQDLRNTKGRAVVKTAYFYQDGDVDARGIRLAIHPNRYRSLEALLGELTEKMPKLGCGARAIYTPTGRNKVRSLADLENNGHYICSERTFKPRGISSDKLIPFRKNGIKEYYPHRLIEYERRVTSKSRGTHKSPHNILPTDPARSNSDSTPSSGSSQLIQMPPLPPLGKPGKPSVEATYSSDWDLSQQYQSKRIYVRLRGDQNSPKLLIIRRRFVKNMNQVLQELSELFQFPIRRLYTISGRRVSPH